MSTAAGTSLTVRDAATRQLLRRFILFLAMLMSGGILAIPRLPLLLLVLVLPLFLVGPFQLVRRETKAIWFLLMAVMGLAMIGGGIHVESLSTRFANFVAALGVLSLYFSEDRSAFAKDLFFLLPWLAVQALLTVFLAVVARDFFSTVEVFETAYHTIGFVFTFHEMIANGSFLPRPDGFFYEPGVFQIYLNIYLYLSLFIFHRLGHAALAFAAVASTQSTTGVVIAVFLVGCFYIVRFKSAGTTERLVIPSIAILVLAPLLFFAAQNVGDKFTGTFRGSAWAREYDLYTGFAVAAEKPLTGIGFNYERYFEHAARVGYLQTQLDVRTISERPNSNGIATLFYTLGFPMALFFLWSLFRQRLLPHRLVVFVLFLLSMSSEALLLTPFMLLFIFSGLLIVNRQRASVAPPARPALATASRR